MSSRTQSESQQAILPSWNTHCKEDADTAKYDCGVFLLIERLLRQEQQSKYYQGCLESRIYTDSASYQRLRTHCTHLEKMLSGVEYQKSQLEASLRHAAEACQVMSRELGFERNKVQELESRLNDLYPTIESLLQRLSSDEQRSGYLNENGTVERLVEENQRQRELISWLQSTLQTRERTVQELKVTLDQVAQELLPGISCQDERERLTVEEPTYSSSEEESCVEIITEKPSSRS